jgi:hypothetical protein
MTYEFARRTTLGVVVLVTDASPYKVELLSQQIL